MKLCVKLCGARVISGSKLWNSIEMTAVRFPMPTEFIVTSGVEM